MSQFKSNGFPTDTTIPTRHTADGEGLSPELHWSKLPEATRELAIIVDDPDAPSPEPFVHWVVYKIPPKVGSLPEGFSQQPKPSGISGVVQGKNSYDHLGYDGPNPPPGSGTHHYRFRLYALDQPIDVQAGASAHALMAAMTPHILDTVELIGRYKRPKR
jgi:Raf kinase inhibitor-like YbhB/YbcL family protein